MTTLDAAGIRAELSDANESLGKRIREAEMMKIPYVLVVGEKEEANKTVNVRDRKGEENEIPLAEFIEKIEKEDKRERYYNAKAWIEESNKPAAHESMDYRLCEALIGVFEILPVRSRIDNVARDDGRRRMSPSGHMPSLKGH